ncbi:MAG: single-strand binding protein [Crocinitomicaceae bacterium]|jgi:single-strand DNA-binding protein|nr:single-strand binding protein [Crocinitomicaceae bacterium]
MKNQITLIGNVGSQPLVTNFENGSKVVRLSIATPYFRNGETKTEWHRLFAWGNVAQFVENFAKQGKKIAVTGKLVHRTFIAHGGKPRQITEIEIRQVIGL